MTLAVPESPDMEDIESFRLRARDWLKRNMPSAPDPALEIPDEERWARARKLQGALYEGGFAGLCYPREYGGQGLSLQYQKVFTEESLPYEMPIVFNIPTLSICLPTILELGTEQQKKQHINDVLCGREVLVEFLSEPHSGSDLAGVLTRAERDGEKWVINGSKIWTSHAYVGDVAMCLARTDWDAPKHRGLTMFLVPVRSPGITIRRIRQVNGKSEFCEEFFDNVVLGPEAVLGEVNGGWAVATRRFYYSRSAWGRGNPYISGDHELSQAQSKGIDYGGYQSLAALAREVQGPSARAPDAVVDTYVNQTVRDLMARRVIEGVESGAMPPEAASMVRLFHAQIDWLSVDARLEVAGSHAVTGPNPENSGIGSVGETFLIRQATSLGGGTTEMARNGISERVLGMPRDVASDLNISFKEARKIFTENRKRK